jgi:FKBP-type peptidyl-prolyl cis-trans isomerase
LYLLLGVGVVALVLIGLEGSSNSDKEQTKLDSGLRYKDEEIGDGPEAKKGDTVYVHYTGRLASNKKQFDSSIGKKPFRFVLGNHEAIEGWDEGIVGMKVGGKRKLFIPAKLGYGARGFGTDIPPNSDLEFDTELVKIEK